MESRLESRFALASLKARMFGHEARVVVGTYEIIELIGRGAMGDVYLAHDPRLGRKVALKLLGPRTADDPKAQTRLLAEARTLAKLTHPNVVTVHDVGSEAGELYLAMEYVEGGDLTAWLAQAPRTQAQIVAVLAAAGRGLAAAHEHGVVHRDFKPSNVLIDRTGNARVVDFGVASLFELPATRDPNDDLAPVDVATTVGAGTPRYMAPEQHRGDPVDARADQFAWSVTLYEALAGITPYGGESGAELLAAKLSNQLQPPRRRIPQRIAAVLRRGLKPDPTARFSSMDAPVRAIERAVVPLWRTTSGRVTLAALAAAAWAVWPSSPPTDPCPPAPVLAEARWSAEHRVAVGAALVAHSPEYGTRAWTWIEPRLTEDVLQWAQLEHRSCESLMQRRELPRVDPRSVCLKRWASTLDHTVEALQTGQFDNMRAAVALVEQQQDPESCQGRSITTRSPLLNDVANLRERDEIMAYLDGLDRARVWQRGSQLERVIDTLRPQVAVAAEHGWLAAQAEAATEVGLALMALDRLDEAVASLREGVTTAVESGHLYIEVQARIALVQTLGERQSQFEIADVERTYAESAVERLDDPLMRAEYELVVGGVLWRKGDPTTAAAHIEKAASLFADNLGTDSLRWANAINQVGSVLRNVEPARAEAALLSALAVFRKKLDPEHPRRLNGLTDLAEAISFQGRYAEAVDLMRDVVARIEAQGPQRQRPMSLIAARYRLANALTAQGQGGEALEELDKAYTSAESHFGADHLSTLAAQSMLGTQALDLHGAAARSGATAEQTARWLQLAQRHIPAASQGYDRALGTQHVDSLLCRFQLGALRVREESFEEARTVLRACVDYRSVLDTPPPAIFTVGVQARLWLADLLWPDEPDEATVLAQEAWTMLDKIVDPRARKSLRTMIDGWLCDEQIAIEGHDLAACGRVLSGDER